MRRKLGRCTNLVRAGDPPVPPGECVFDRSFPASEKVKSETCEALVGVLTERARLCVDEALTNAIMHGCKYDSSKLVRVRAFVTPDEWSVLVEDPGPGFREEDLPDRFPSSGVCATWSLSSRSRAPWPLSRT
ncbi:MAG: ATP-binding protein [Planctomycetota bacterium]|nr:ATP-binding protein [Planctomycetota bacterium]